jgi:hypothetical protein
LYTSDQWGQAATSEDLQKAFDAVNTGNHAADKKGGGGGGKKGSKASEKNAPKSVDSLFDLWVFGVPNTGKSK